MVFDYIDLQLFADGGAGGGSTGGGDGGSQAAAGAETAAPQRTRAKTNPLADVKYGIQTDDAAGNGASDAGEQTQPKPADQRRADFDALIRGEYKDVYGESVSKIVQDRLKNTKADQDRLKTLSPTIDALYARYGVEDDAGLIKAINDDTKYLEDKSVETGIPVETLKRLDTLERKNAQSERERNALLQQQQQQAQQEEARKIYDGWMNEVSTLKNLYPSLDLNKELTNPQFRQLMGVRGMSIKTAYEVVHKDDLIAGAVRQTQKSVADSVKAGATRPAENGIKPSAAINQKTDVTKLTRADREEVARRVARGEKVTFG